MDVLPALIAVRQALMPAHVGVEPGERVEAVATSGALILWLIEFVFIAEHVTSRVGPGPCWPAF